MPEKNTLETVELLKEIQVLDQKIRAIRKDHDVLPKRLSEIDAEKKTEQADIFEANRHLQDVEKERDRIEKEVAFDRSALTQFETKSQEVTSGNAFSAAGRELDNRKKMIKGKEEEVLRLMEQAETINKKIEQLQSAFSETGKKFEEQASELKKHVDEAHEKTSELREQRDKLAANVDKAILSRYDKIFDRKDGIGIVPVVAEVCQGCYMGVPPQIVNHARVGLDGIQNCAHCHRIIFWQPQENPPEED